MTTQASPAVLPSLRQPLSSRRASDLVLTGNAEVNLCDRITSCLPTIHPELRKKMA